MDPLLSKTASEGGDVGGDMDALNSIAKCSNEFTIHFYNELIKTESGNVFVSPLSVQMVLALAYTGAGGATASELKSLLSLPDSLDQTLSEYLSLVKNLQDPVLKLANHMFVEETVQVKEDFQNNAQKYFLSPAEIVGFKADPELSRQQINLWVENQTNKKITNILRPGTIDNYTRLVLVNAAYFKADWKFKFHSNNNRKWPFYVSKTETKEIDIMQITAQFGYSESKTLKSRILKMDYEGTHFCMLVILPDEMDGLADLEGTLNKVDLYDELSHLQYPVTVDVKLPKFKAETRMELNNILKSMGVKTMFGSSADFSKLSEEKLYVSQVIQKAFVEVNEEGTEATCATGMVASNMWRPSLPPPNPRFIADHPFLYAIIDRSSKTTLFLGRFIHPE